MRTHVMTFEELEAEALKLSSQRRAELAHILLLSLDGLDRDQEPDPRVRQAAAEEAERRYRDYLDGKTQPIPGEEAFRRIRASLR
jgi:putative addiction module component (TIGR02574 family)